MATQDERYPEIGEWVIYKGKRHMITSTAGNQIWILDERVAPKGIVGDISMFEWSEEKKAWVIRPMK